MGGEDEDGGREEGNPMVTGGIPISVLGVVPLTQGTSLHAWGCRDYWGWGGPGDSIEGLKR